MQLRLDITKQPKAVVVRCQGRIVFGQEVDDLRLAVLSLLKETNRVILALSSVDHIDSEGLAALVGLFISARNRGGELKLAELSAKAQELLRVTRLDEVFKTYKSVDEAIASLQPKKAIVAGPRPRKEDETQF